MPEMNPSTPANSPAEALIPRISAVIPAFGRTDYLRKAVCSLLRQDLPAGEYEIIVVDSSLDEANSVMVLALRDALAPIIAYMDSDCEASPSWLRAGLAAFDDGVGFVQGRTRPDPDGRISIFCHFVQVEEENALYQTANMFYRREALEQAGGCAADLTPLADKPTGGEDTETAWVVIRLGWEKRFCGDALVYHAIVQAHMWQWLFIKPLFCFPRLTRRFPEFRQFLYRSYFVDKGQALLVLALCGLAAGPLWNPVTLVLALPYAIFRASEPTHSLGGILRPLRIAPYFVRDCISLCILAAASLRYRSLVL
ncbi:MAG: glycosyltransferase family 2 protein [Acidobacteria bacterium]|nr:glycosyltransferase family 2 protein [Acidobacteriota bacterium]